MDTTLVIQAQSGDRGAFARLVDTEWERLRRLAYGILRDRHLAEDATQEAFIDIWRTIRRRWHVDGRNGVWVIQLPISFRCNERQVWFLKTDRQKKWLRILLCDKLPQLRERCIGNRTVSRNMIGDVRCLRRRPAHEKLLPLIWIIGITLRIT